MILWIVLAIVYILIGIGILIVAVKGDGLMIEFWWVIIFFYPIIAISYIYQKSKRE